LLFLALILSIYHFAFGKKENENDDAIEYRKENISMIHSYNASTTSNRRPHTLVSFNSFAHTLHTRNFSSDKCPWNPWAHAASKRFGVPKNLLECIRYYETRYGCSGEHGSYLAYQVLERKRENRKAFFQICKMTRRNPYTIFSSRSGALGPFQYMPKTWLRYAIDGDGDGIASPFSLADSTFTAAHHLSKLRNVHGTWRAAIRSYNNSSSYVQKVITCAYF